MRRVGGFIHSQQLALQLTRACHLRGPVPPFGEFLVHKMRLSMSVSITALIAAASLAAHPGHGSTAKALGYDEAAPGAGGNEAASTEEWDISNPPGESRMIEIDTDEGTWMSLAWLLQSFSGNSSWSAVGFPKQARGL